MENTSLDNAATFSALKWDTEFFGVRCAKAILHKPQTLNQWNKIEANFKGFQFVSIENRDADPVNAQLIGRYTTAFLADVNIQFVKRLHEKWDVPSNISIHQSLAKEQKIFEIADFQFSKFTEDPELAKRGGDQVYNQWLLNSFDKSDKHFTLSKNEDGEVNGFLLHSYSDNVCIVELIAVSKKTFGGGIGTNLFRTVETTALEYGCDEIKVGTQGRNIGAINFYQKVGCKQVGCHQVYHLWNL